MNYFETFKNIIFASKVGNPLLCSSREGRMEIRYWKST